MICDSPETLSDVKAAIKADPTLYEWDENAIMDMYVNKISKMMNALLECYPELYKRFVGEIDITILYESSYNDDNDISYYEMTEDDIQF